MKHCLNRMTTICCLLATVAFVLQSSRAWAHDGDEAHHHPPVKVSDKVAWRPTANPDRIALTWKTSPATSQAVSWRTDETVTRALAEIAEAEDGPLFVANVERDFAATTPFESDLGLAHYHSFNFTGLIPETKYVYRVGDGANWSEWSHFTTASESAKPFTFVYFGDAQNDIKSHWSRVVREAYKDAPGAAFLLHAGDLVNSGNRDSDWGEWFYSLGFIARSMSCIAVPGNHEYPKFTDPDTNVVTRQLSRYWQPTFAFPENGPDGSREDTYWLDYQGTRIIALNSNANHEAQTRWLQTVLADNPQRWTIITFHHPIYSSKAGRDNNELRNLWQPLFDQYRVDLVLTGHDHTYARSKLMTHGDEQNVATGVRKQSPKAGTVYVVSVSGPKMYDLGRRPFMRRAAEDTQLYQVITVDDDELRYEARTATGRAYDAFTLKKRPGQANELIERIPDTPERRRPSQPESDVPKLTYRESDNLPLAEPSVTLTNPRARDQADLCIWRNTRNPDQSTLITSDKSADNLFVYDLAGQLIQTVEIAKPGNIDLRSGFPLGDERIDLVVVNQDDDDPRLCVFRIDPESRRLVRVDQGDIRTGSNSGGCLYHSLKTDHFFYITTSADTGSEQFELTDDGQGHVVGKKVREWAMGKSAGAVADDANGHLYIAEEKKGIWRMDAEPSGSPDARLILEVGQSGLAGDLKGVALAAMGDGDRYLVFSDQGPGRLHVLPLDGSTLTRQFGITGAKATDGVDLVMGPLGESFPFGLVACHSNGSPCPILVTPLERVLVALGVR
jgi:myo-inositol-hexaphosphate 3-phosphohydrolase/predicted phosphodiesterase